MQGTLAAENAKVRMHMGKSTRPAVGHHREQEQNVGGRMAGTSEIGGPLSANFIAVL